MQDGDLALWVRPRYIVVLEGVLCNVIPVTRKRFGHIRIVGYHTQWHDVPLKRLVYLKDRWPETAQDIVSFVSPTFVDEAAEFLDSIHIQYDHIYYQALPRFCDGLRFQPDVQGVYDSDPDRLDQYGQLGVSVNKGWDF